MEVIRGLTDKPNGLINSRVAVSLTSKFSPDRWHGFEKWFYYPYHQAHMEVSCVLSGIRNTAGKMTEGVFASSVKITAETERNYREAERHWRSAGQTSLLDHLRWILRHKGDGHFETSNIGDNIRGLRMCLATNVVEVADKAQNTACTGWVSSRTGFDMDQKLSAFASRYFQDWFLHPHHRATLYASCGLSAVEDGSKNLSDSVFSSAVQITAENEESYRSAESMWFSCGEQAAMWDLREMIRKGKSQFEVVRPYWLSRDPVPYQVVLTTTLLPKPTEPSEWDLLMKSFAEQPRAVTSSVQLPTSDYVCIRTQAATTSEIAQEQIRILTH